MITKMKTIAATTALAAIMTLGANAASAATITTCSTVVADKVTGTSACEVLTFGSGNPTSAEIDLLFAPPTDGWEFVEKDEQIPQNTGDLTLTGDTKSGTWTVAQSVFDTYTRVMLVFKSADESSPATPEGVVAYILSATTGNFTTPFTNSNTGNPMDISYVAVYGQMSPIPLPAAGWLLLMGIGGLGVASRRRRKAQHS